MTPSPTTETPAMGEASGEATPMIHESSPRATDLEGCFVNTTTPTIVITNDAAEDSSSSPSPVTPLAASLEANNEASATIQLPLPDTSNSSNTTTTTITTSASDHKPAAGSSSTNSSTNNKSSKPPKQKPKSSKDKKKDHPLIPAAIDFGKLHQDDATARASFVDGRIQLGICAMDKKARSKPMAEILSRLDESLFRVVFFGDDLILNKPIQEWPSNIDVLVAFYSKGYPLQKAKDYVKLRKPHCLNDLDMQEKLKDRRMVYDLLEASGIDVPRHVFLSQDGYKSTGSGDGNQQGETTVSEFDDHIEINGVAIHKPFVEKPVDADDHNIAIYYPTSAGGGCKKLFRKIGNRSSEFYPDIHEIRRDGSYVYEEFVETQGTDVKMYTVGPDYGHAEARKSPTVDGKVQRNADGKELRFPVILTLSEKEIARRIVLQFKQFVCGFDLLRVQEGHNVVSYCCDVNGFSFVKNSRKYYDDCAQILTEHMLAIMKPEEFGRFSTLDPLVTEVDDVEQVETNSTFMNPLQRVARLLQRVEINSLDGTPQPLPHHRHQPSDAVSEEGLETRSVGHLSTGMLSSSEDHPTLLEEGALPVRQIPRDLMSEPASLPVSRDVSCEDLLKKGADEEQTQHQNNSNNNNNSNKLVDSTSNQNLHNNNSNCNNNTTNTNTMSRNSLVSMHQEELRCVIAVVRHADRTPKEKLKLNTSEPIILNYYSQHSEEKNSTKDLKIKDKAPMTQFLKAVRDIVSKYDGQTNRTKDDEKLLWKFKHMKDVLERWKITGLNRKLQIKPKKIHKDEETGRETVKEVQLILKWGGDLTKLGENQAIQLGQQFRSSIYPDSPGGGVLRLHSTFRHDLKIKTSDEGRVMKTAAAFAKGLLDLEGDIPPILVSLVHKEKGSMHMLDPSGDKDAKLELDECKEKISMHLQEDIDWQDMTEEDRVRLVGPPEVTSLRDALAKIGNPRKTLRSIYETMGTLIAELEEMLGKFMENGEEGKCEAVISKGDSEDADAQLSGVKLYKGETLLELTERWRFIYKRLYDAETDKFDLTRIPDVLDNVRFDVLHNPHLGLTSVLHKLYSLAKAMADTVVPQEYGTTLAEKRSVGIKVCSSLLEKIRFDLHIARTDNKTDMRYMINMDYSADLPINTMGRRIRTRLYFTSESHLHTLINVLRFAAHKDSSSESDCSSPVLSAYGMNFLNDSKEACYLTQVVIRLFEDTGRRMSDPRRYRVEILFSAGATGTPIHQCKSTKERDSTRLDTDPLIAVGRDGLTCQEVEEFFDSIITERGKSDGNHDLDTISDPGAPKSKPTTPKATTLSISKGPDATGMYIPCAANVNINNGGENVELEKAQAIECQAAAANETNEDLNPEPKTTDTTASNGNGNGKVVGEGTESSDSTTPNEKATAAEKATDDDNDKAIRDHKYFYMTIATTSLLLGAGCLFLAMGLTGRPRTRRNYARR